MDARAHFDKPDLESLKRSFFVADLHHHTTYSHDSGTPVRHVLDQCEELGIYAAITDHNTITGVLKAFESPRGRKWVIPGIEISSKEYKDVLVYFYSVEDLRRFFHKKVRPHLKTKSSLRRGLTTYPLAEMLDDLADERCVVVLPHPVCARMKSTYHYFQKSSREPLLEYVHGIEVINETMTRKNNLAALGWAMALGKPVTAGSDGHRMHRLGQAVTYAEAGSKTEFLDAVKAGRALVQGRELRFNQRLRAAVSLVAEKARVRANKRLDAEFEEF